LEWATTRAANRPISHQSPKILSTAPNPHLNLSPGLTRRQACPFDWKRAMNRDDMFAIVTRLFVLAGIRTAVRI
jgi:hypothetical protein